MRLRVEQFGALVGWLESTADRGVVFRYDAAYCDRPGATPLSLSLPLREKEFSQAAAMPFFAGLLPDGDLRRRIADWLHVSESSSLRLLDALGGECAGTVSLINDKDEGDADRAAPGYEEITDEAFAGMIRDAERIPLLTPRNGARLSLAGAQDKLPLLRRDGRWYRPLGGAPSSHILKPASAAFPGIVANEYACLKLAEALGLPVPKAEIAGIGRPVLILERFDRIEEGEGRLARLQQEDSCQALGIMPDRKYQADGGPGFTDIAALIRRACSAPLADMEGLVGIALFNLMAGNCDAHGKNFSLLRRGGRLGLAPFYDLVATTFWPELDTKLSMRVGREYRLEMIGQADLDDFAADLGVKPLVVRERRDAMIKAAIAGWDTVVALPELAGERELLSRIRAGWEQRARRLSGRG